MLLYLTSVEYDCLIARIPRSRAAEVPFSESIAGMSFGLSRTAKLVTYRASDANGKTLEGLFAGNPVISVEGFRPQDLREKAIEEAEEEYRTAVAKETGTFLLDVLPLRGASAFAKASLSLLFSAIPYLSDAEASKPKTTDYALLGRESMSLILDKVCQGHVKAAEAASTGLAEAKALAASAKRQGAIALKAWAFLEKTQVALEKFRDKVAQEVSPLKLGAGFGKDWRSKDLLVLLRVNEVCWEIVATGSGFEGKKKQEVALSAQCVRPIDVGSQLPYNFCFGPTGGLLERDDASACGCSLDVLLEDYFEKLLACKKVLDDVPKKTFEDYLNWLATNHAQAQKMGLSTEVQRFLETGMKDEQAKAYGLHGTYLRGQLNEAEVRDLVAKWCLWNYLDATLVICPSCRNQVQLNWGWCPFHPQTDGKLLKKEDANGADGWHDEFVTWIRDNHLPKYNVATVSEYLSSVPATMKDRLFVHCSEFIITK